MSQDFVMIGSSIFDLSPLAFVERIELAWRLKCGEFSRATDEKGNELDTAQGVPGRWITLRDGRRIWINAKVVNEGVSQETTEAALKTINALPPAFRANISAIYVKKDSILTTYPIATGAAVGAITFMGVLAYGHLSKGGKLSELFTGKSIASAYEGYADVGMLIGGFIGGAAYHVASGSAGLLGTYEFGSEKLSVWPERAKKHGGKQLFEDVVNHEAAHSLFSRPKERSLREQGVMKKFTDASIKEGGVTDYAALYAGYDSMFPASLKGYGDHIQASENFAETHMIYRRRGRSQANTRGWNALQKKHPETAGAFLEYLDLHNARQLDSVPSTPTLTKTPPLEQIAEIWVYLDKNLVLSPLESAVIARRTQYYSDGKANIAYVDIAADAKAIKEA